MNRKKMFRAFTLVEMLIVIVIIGLLSRALIPRLTSARGRANDTARKADLRQIGTAVTMYQMDKGSYPESTSIDFEASALLPYVTKVWMTKIPTDPIKKDIVANLIWWHPVLESYMYVSLWKWGIYNNAFALVSFSETEGWANWINSNRSDNNRYIFSDSSSQCDAFQWYCDIDDIRSHLCTKLVKSTSNYNWWTWYCTYTTVEDLRYVFLSQ